MTAGGPDPFRRPVRTLCPFIVLALVTCGDSSGPDGSSLPIDPTGTWEVEVEGNLRGSAVTETMVISISDSAYCADCGSGLAQLSLLLHGLPSGSVQCLSGRSELRSDSLGDASHRGLTSVPWYVMGVPQGVSQEDSRVGPAPDSAKEVTMAAPRASGVGSVMSADIAAPEHEREVRFYSSVLTTGDIPLWRGDLMNGDGIPIIGLGERDPLYADLPLQWMPHIQVADVGESAERALDRGGRELMHHRNALGQSQWALFADPDGAAFGLIPVVAPDSIPNLHGSGRIAWLDLTVPNASETRDFYRDVVGWSHADVEMKDASGPYVDYALRTPGGAAVAGICHARGVNEGLPPLWLICLPVGDLEESLSRVREEGGEVLDARKGSAGECTYAVIRDPVGVCLALRPA